MNIREVLLGQRSHDSGCGVIAIARYCISSDRLCLTEAGIYRSDTIGSWLFSDTVRQLIKEYQLK